MLFPEFIIKFEISYVDFVIKYSIWVNISLNIKQINDGTFPKTTLYTGIDEERGPKEHSIEKYTSVRHIHDSAFVNLLTFYFSRPSTVFIACTELCCHLSTHLQITCNILSSNILIH